MTDTQKKVLNYVTDLAKPMHAAALDRLHDRVVNLKYNGPNVVIQKILDYIAEEAPIYVNIDLDRLIDVLLKDPVLRNQFETNTSRGALGSPREIWEHNLFNGLYGSNGKERPKYGYMHYSADPAGDRLASNYGRYIFEIEGGIRDRITMVGRDSAGIYFDRYVASNHRVYKPGEMCSFLNCMGTLKYCAHIITYYFSDWELNRLIKVATGQKIDQRFHGHHYKEVQIHSDLNLTSCLKRIHVPRDTRNEVKIKIDTLAQKTGSEIVFF